MLTESKLAVARKTGQSPGREEAQSPEPLSERCFEAFEQFLADWVHREQLIRENEARRRRAPVTGRYRRRQRENRSAQRSPSESDVRTLFDT